MFGELSNVIIHDAAQLRRLIAENPEFPIVVLVGEEANSGDYSWAYCMDVYCSVTYILDISNPYDNDGERVFTDKDKFEDAIADSYLPDDGIWTEEKMNAYVKAELEKYEPYWKKVIAIYATN